MRYLKNDIIINSNFEFYRTFWYLRIFQIQISRTFLTFKQFFRIFGYENFNLIFPRTPNSVVWKIQIENPQFSKSAGYFKNEDIHMQTMLKNCANIKKCGKMYVFENFLMSKNEGNSKSPYVQKMREIDISICQKNAGNSNSP